MYWRRTVPLLLLAGNALAVEGFIVGGGVEADSADGVAVSGIIDIGLTEKTWLTGAIARNSVDVQSGLSIDTWYGDVSLDHWFDPVGVRGGGCEAACKSCAGRENPPGRALPGWGGRLSSGC